MAALQGARLATAVLAGICGILLLLVLALQFGLGRGYSWLPPEIDQGAVLTSATVDRTPFKLPPETSFVATQERPLFNDDRKPTPDVPDEPDTPPPPKVPLNIALTGIVLTPQVRLAMIHDKAKNTNVALKEGMPMPGDQGGWTLSHINDRSVVFKESSGEEVEVELSTAVSSPRPNVPGPGQPEGRGPAGRFVPRSPVAPPGQNVQAGQLQQRIEERRKQMREEAERLRQQPRRRRQPPKQ